MQKLPFRAPSMAALILGYDAWAATYDEDVRRLGYATPERIADALCECVADRNARLLDVGAGTGLLGKELHGRGFRHLIGMDASYGMLSEAARKGIYGGLSRMALGRPLGFANQTFDGLLAAGIFSSGHVSPESFTEICRVVRPGGWVVFSLKWDGIFENIFLPEIQLLEVTRQWQRHAWSALYPSWPGADPAMRARVLTYRVL